MALTNKLTAIANAIRAKTGGSSPLSLDDMVDEIGTISGGGGITVSGNLSHFLGYDRVNDQLNKITTSNVTNISAILEYSSFLIDASPLVLNFDLSADSYNIAYAFNNCNRLEILPTIGAYPNNKLKITSISSVFYGCSRLRDASSFFNIIDFSAINNIINNNAASNEKWLFYDCFSLRNIPSNILKQIYTSNPTYCLILTKLSNFVNCYALDELVGLPVGKAETVITTNQFGNFSSMYCRIKNIIFDTDNGIPYVRSWKNQNINLNINYLGYSDTDGRIRDYNSGIDSSKKVANATSYNNLKNNPDWYTLKWEYSRYNHDSAVNTINSLPDTSAYLATAGGTNSITFKGSLGQDTDGGAINTLTNEEIAVATAKGWTVSLS